VGEEAADFGSVAGEVGGAVGWGVDALPTRTRAFSATQAAWRFDNNERGELCELVEPLRADVRERLSASPVAFVRQHFCNSSSRHGTRCAASPPTRCVSEGERSANV